jgi:hypothetical protein
MKGEKRNEKMSKRKFVEKVVFCFALMFFLQGCEDASSATNSYAGIAIISVVILYGVCKYNEDSYPDPGPGLWSVSGIAACLSGISFIVCTTLGIISYVNDKKYNSLFTDNPIISFCRYSGGIFSETHSISVEQPFIIIKKVKKDDKDILVLVHYSEKNRLDEKAIENLKTIVFTEDVFGTVHNYGRYGNKTTSITVYNAVISCFNLKNKQYEEIRIENDFIPPEKTTSGGSHRVRDDRIIEVVKSKIIPVLQE